MKKTVIFGLMVLTLTATLSSCMSTRTNVSYYQGVQGEEYKYARGKQCYLFWGLLPLGRTNVDTPADGVCQIRTYHNFGDFIVSLLTGGIFDMQTIKVMAKRPAPVQNQVAYPYASQQQPLPQQPAPAAQPVAQQPEQAAQPAPAPATANPADLNGDGSVSADEQQTYDIIFQQADSNRNGVIDETERPALERMLQRARK